MLKEPHHLTEFAVDRRREDRRETARQNTTTLEAAPVVRKERRKVERRRYVDPTTCERDYNDEEIEFMRAMDDYKRRSGRQFPTWSEVLEVIRSLGYEKTGSPTTIQI